MTLTPRISVLIVSYNTRELLLEAIESVIDEAEVEVIVADNASRDGSAEAVTSRFPSVRLVRSAINLGFAGGVNRAAECARGRALLVLNSDARLEPGALDALLELLDRMPKAAMVAPALRYTDGRPQPAAFKFPGLAQLAMDLFPVDRLADSKLNGRIHAKAPASIDHPLGACMLIRRSAWEAVGPLDEGYFMYLEEVDWCRRARLKGWQIWHHPGAVGVHHGGSSTRQHADAMFVQLWRSRLRYYTRFHGLFYNRVVHALVRLGLRRREADPALEAVRRLAS